MFFYCWADEILRAEEKCVKIRPSKVVPHKELSSSLGQPLLKLGLKSDRLYLYILLDCIVPNQSCWESLTSEIDQLLPSTWKVKGLVLKEEH